MWPSTLTTTPVTSVPAGLVSSRTASAPVSSVDVGVLERGADRDDLGVRFGVHEAREPVAVLTPHALAVGRVALVEQDPARGVERVEPGLGEVVGQLLDPRLVRRPRGTGTGALAGGSVGILAARTVHLVELLGLGVVRLHLVVGDRPRRRDPVVVPELAEVLRRAAGTARRRRAWSRRRRSNAPGAGTPCRPRSTRCPARRSGRRRTRPAASQFSGSRVSQPPRSSSRIRLPDGARWRTSVPPPAPLPITITS